MFQKLGLDFKREKEIRFVVLFNFILIGKIYQFALRGMETPVSYVGDLVSF
jgi:hypothetical protein